MQLKLPKDSFIPPDGWSFDGKWFVNPELRCVYEQLYNLILLTKKKRLIYYILGKKKLIIIIIIIIELGY